MGEDRQSICYTPPPPANKGRSFLAQIQKDELRRQVQQDAKRQSLKHLTQRTLEEDEQSPLGAQFTGLKQLTVDF